MKKFKTGIIAAAACLLLAACSSQSGEVESTAAETGSEEAVVEESTEAAAEETEGEPEETTVTLAAAASLEYAFTEQLIPMFEEANPGIMVEGPYDSSAKLQTQIEEGLEADVFMSALANYFPPHYRHFHYGVTVAVSLS